MEGIREGIQFSNLDVNGMIDRIKVVLPGVLHDNFHGQHGLNNDDLVTMILAYQLYKLIETLLHLAEYQNLKS